MQSHLYCRPATRRLCLQCYVWWRGGAGNKLFDKATRRVQELASMVRAKLPSLDCHDEMLDCYRHLIIFLPSTSPIGMRWTIPSTTIACHWNAIDEAHTHTQLGATRILDGNARHTELSLSHEWDLQYLPPFIGTVTVALAVIAWPEHNGGDSGEEP